MAGKKAGKRLFSCLRREQIFKKPLKTPKSPWRKKNAQIALAAAIKRQTTTPLSSHDSLPVATNKFACCGRDSCGLPATAFRPQPTNLRAAAGRPFSIFPYMK